MQESGPGHRIPNAMAPCFFEVTPQPREDNKHALLYVGAIQPRKGLLYLVEALARLRDQFPNSIVLRVIGTAGGTYKDEVIQRAVVLNVAGQIEWLGVLNERDVAQVLARSDLLVLPSFWENMPMCIGEAFAAGCQRSPPVRPAYPTGWTMESTGLLVKPGDSAGTCRRHRPAFARRTVAACHGGRWPRQGHSGVFTAGRCRENACRLRNDLSRRGARLPGTLTFG